LDFQQGERHEATGMNHGLVNALTSAPIIGAESGHTIGLGD